jgi:hypothetical protein
VRWIGVIGIFASLVTVSVNAMDATRPCLGLPEGVGRATDSFAPSMQPLLTDNQCKALKSRELRVLLLEIPQEKEDPIALSLGVKGSGVILHFNVPFSF